MNVSRFEQTDCKLDGNHSGQKKRHQVKSTNAIANAGLTCSLKHLKSLYIFVLAKS